MEKKIKGRKHGKEHKDEEKDDVVVVVVVAIAARESDCGQSSSRFFYSSAFDVSFARSKSHCPRGTYLHRPNNTKDQSKRDGSGVCVDERV